MAKVRFEKDGDVGVVTLDDPPLNLFGTDLTRDLIAALDEAGAAKPRALLIRAVRHRPCTAAIVGSVSRSARGPRERGSS